MTQTTYDIKIINNSGARHSNGVILEPPHISNQEDVVVWPCVLRVTEPVEDGTATNISITMPTMAIIGSSAVPFNDRTPIHIGQEKALGQNHNLFIDVDARLGAPYFTTQLNGRQRNGNPGEDTFETAVYDFQTGAHIWSGLGSCLSNEDVIPAYIWPIQPSQSYTFSETPLPKFLIFRGAREMGTIGDTVKLEERILIDFTHKPFFKGHVEDTSSGHFLTQTVSPTCHIAPTHGIEPEI
ncbi:hypothetical protein AA313_de0209998 [Arthrobotrys entomopaga]|nr:hypothetical protein AA313_de0209998 [Arthrobotrys entomopaga]